MKIPPAAAQNVYTQFMMGEVPDSLTLPTNIASLANGLSFKSFGYPVDTTISNLLVPAVSGNQVIFFRGTNGYKIETFATFPAPAHWSPGTNVLYAGDGLMLRRGSITNWVQVKPYTWP